LHPTTERNADVRYFDCTRAAEFCTDASSCTVERDLPQEIDYLRRRWMDDPAGRPSKGDGFNEVSGMNLV
jgi:hypothetical protein